MMHDNGFGKNRAGAFVPSLMKYHAAWRTQTHKFGPQTKLVMLNYPNNPTGAAPTEAELRAWLAERLPPDQVPRIIRFVDRLSSTASGKALRR
jgi:acyl-CoA synthetase (AMP-forming)/AMP-acid ligase II